MKNEKMMFVLVFAAVILLAGAVLFGQVAGHKGGPVAAKVVVVDPSKPGETRFQAPQEAPVVRESWPWMFEVGCYILFGVLLGYGTSIGFGLWNQRLAVKQKAVAEQVAEAVKGLLAKELRGELEARFPKPPPLNGKSRRSPKEAPQGALEDLPIPTWLQKEQELRAAFGFGGPHLLVTPTPQPPAAAAHQPGPQTLMGRVILQKLADGDESLQMAHLPNNIWHLPD